MRQNGTRRSSTPPGSLPPEALAAFSAIQNALTSKPFMAFPRADAKCTHYGCCYWYCRHCWRTRRHFNTKRPIGQLLRHILCISSTQRSRKNYSHFLLESAAAVWGMNVFNEYFKGKKFILFTDHKPLEKMGHLLTQTMNKLLCWSTISLFNTKRWNYAGRLPFQITSCKWHKNCWNHRVFWPIPAISQGFTKSWHAVSKH